MPSLLIDSCALLWATGDPARLGPEAARLIADARNRIVVSVGTLWELSIKVTVGKLTLPARFFESLPALGFETLQISAEHLVEYRRLPMHHRDPFDRLLVAQARVERIDLVTCDPEIRHYKVTTRW